MGCVVYSVVYLGNWKASFFFNSLREKGFWVASFWQVTGWDGHARSAGQRQDPKSEGGSFWGWWVFFFEYVFGWYCWWKKSGESVEVGSLSHYCTGFYTFRGLFEMSSTNSILTFKRGMDQGSFYLPKRRPPQNGSPPKGDWRRSAPIIKPRYTHDIPILYSMAA